MSVCTLVCNCLQVIIFEWMKSNGCVRKYSIFVFYTLFQIELLECLGVKCIFTMTIISFAINSQKTKVGIQAIF